MRILLIVMVVILLGCNGNYTPCDCESIEIYGSPPTTLFTGPIAVTKEKIRERVPLVIENLQHINLIQGELQNLRSQFNYGGIDNDVLLDINCKDGRTITVESNDLIVKIGWTYYNFEDSLYETLDSILKEEDDAQVEIDSGIDSVKTPQVVKDIVYAVLPSGHNDIPPSGRYKMDVAFDEWQGKSMGVEVAVIIKGTAIQVVYEGVGSLSLTEPGDVIDEGQIMKHKSGVWIIATSVSDTELDDVGGCSGGPAIVDFKNGKYWMC